ncbi:MAG: enoyl-CoA hydratase/isomerase family protein [Phycisphaerales bacterium]|nr:enoyl-CoA hydratase/isomerase family protein [Phycisphaerales bacterium]
MTSLIKIERTQNFVQITLQAPERRNALDPAMIDCITEVACEANDASVLLLQGSGCTFCAGFDVHLMRQAPDSVDVLIAALSQACRALRRCSATVVVDVQGAAVAGGCALAMSADVVIARRGARLGYPVHALGISPAVTLPVLIPAADGLARTMVMNGRLHSAESLASHGVVHHLLDANDDISQIIDPLLQRGQHAAHVTKQWLNTLDGSWDDERFDGPVEGSRGLRIRAQDSPES